MVAMILKILSFSKCNISIITIKNVDYRSIIHNIIKSEAINLLEFPVPNDRGY